MLLIKIIQTKNEQPNQHAISLSLPWVGSSGFFNQWDKSWSFSAHACSANFPTSVVSRQRFAMIYTVTSDIAKQIE